MPSKFTPEKQIYKEIHKEKEISKDTKDHKDNKDHPDKLKHEKELKEQRKEKVEKLEKHERKEISKSEFELPQAQLDPGPEELTAASAEQATPLKLTDKTVVVDKFFKSEYEKHPKLEKLEFWEKHFKLEKYEHGEVLTPTNPVGPDPEARLAALEAAFAQLAHFIPQELRPDLSKGALKQEAEKPEPAEAPKEHSKEKK